MNPHAIAFPRWRISVAEDLRVADCNGVDATPRSRKMRAVIGILVVSPAHSITRQDLIALLWSNRGAEQARASLRQCLFMLRADLPALAEADGDRLWLMGANVDLDKMRLTRATLTHLYGLDPAFDRWLTEHVSTAEAEVRAFAPVVSHVTAASLLRRHIWLTAFVVGGVLLAAITAELPHGKSTAGLPALPVIAIVPFEATPRLPAADAIATRMSNDIRVLLPADRAVVRASDVAGDRLQQASRLGAEWIISGRVEAKDDAGKVHVQIETPDGRLIWGRDVEAAPGQLADAATVAGTRMAMATGCALGGPQVRRDVDVLGLLFAGCERLDFSADNYNHLESLVALRRLADRAPDDALAQGYFGTGLAVLADDMPANLAAMQRVEAVRRLDRALRLDARVGEAWIGRFALVRDNRAYALKEMLLSRGLAVEPNNPMLNLFMGSLLFSVGRGQEGLIYAQRANALAPAYLASGQLAAGILSAAGRPREALALLDLADRRFPRNARQAWQRLDALLTNGDTAAARALLDRAQETPGFLEPAREGELRRLTYALDAPHGPLAATVARDAVAAAKATPELASREFGVLVDLDRKAAAFDLARHYPLPSERFFELRSRSILFNPEFPVIARYAGLWNYWQHTGHWPDVCREPQLPWRCGAGVKRASIAG